jgi:hypothetical protein
MIPQPCLLLWPRWHLIQGHSPISQYPTIGTTQPLRCTIAPVCFPRHMERSTLCSNSQTRQSILCHTKILPPYLPPPLPLQNIRKAGCKQNRTICSRLPCHLPDTHGSEMPLFCHRCPSKNPLTNEYQPQHQEGARKTTLPPYPTRARHRRHFQQYQPIPPLLSHATMGHATIPMHVDTSIYHQPNTFLLFYPTDRRPKTILLQTTPGLTRLTSPLPHLRQCHARGTTQPGPQNQHIIHR